MANTGTIRIRSVVDPNGVNDGLKGISSRIRGFESSFSRSRGMTGYIDSMVTGFAKAGLAIQGVRTIVGGLASVVSAPLALAAAAQQTQVSFEVMTSSAETASKLVADLRTMGAATPFEFADLSQATTVLLSFGRTSQDVLRDLDMLSNVASGNKDKLAGLSVVYGQVASAGKLMGGDVLQMINQGFNPLNEIAKRTGESMSDLRSRMSKGNVSFEEVRQAFEDATSAGGQFFQMNDKQSKTLSGLWSTLQDETSSALQMIGEELVSTFDLSEVVASITTFVSVLKSEYLPVIVSNLQYVLHLVSAFADWKRVLSTVIPVIFGVVTVMTAVVAVQKAIAMGQAIVLALSGPAGWATLAAGAAIGAGAYYALSGVMSGVSDEMAKATAEAKKLNQETGKDQSKSPDSKPVRQDQSGIDDKIKQVTKDLKALSGEANSTADTLQDMLDKGASPQKVAQLKKLLDQLDRAKKEDTENKKLKGAADRIKEQTKSVSDQLQEQFDQIDKIHEKMDENGNPLISIEQMVQAKENARKSLLSSIIPDDEWATFNDKVAELNDLMKNGWIDAADVAKATMAALPSEIASAIEASKTPLQKYEEQLAKLQKGVDAGVLSPEQMKKASMSALPQSVQQAIEDAKTPLQKYKEQLAELESFRGKDGVTDEVLAKAQKKLKQDIFGGGESGGNNRLADLQLYGSAGARDSIIRHQMRLAGIDSPNEKLLKETQAQTKYQMAMAEATKETAKNTKQKPAGKPSSLN